MKRIKRLLAHEFYKLRAEHDYENVPMRNSRHDDIQLEENKDVDKIAMGRRDYDEQDIIDTTYKLTYEEVVELKRIAQLSKVTRAVVLLLMGIVSVVGLPAALEWTTKHFSW